MLLLLAWLNALQSCFKNHVYQVSDLIRTSAYATGKVSLFALMQIAINNVI
jgi:hypothetical protein